MLKAKKEMKNLLFIITGAFILAFGMYHFNYQNDITEGGILGLLLFFKNVFDISPGITNIVIDLSLFLLGMKFFGKSFLVHSLLCTFSFSTFYTFFENAGPFVKPLTGNMLLGSILAGIFVGVGVGLVVCGNAASGGDDVIAILVAKFTPLKVNHVYLMTDLLVLGLSLMYIPFKDIFWSLIAVFISGKIISLFYYASHKHEETEEELEEIKEV